MFFQKVLKGITGLTTPQADAYFDEGIVCNWWRTVGTISPAQRLAQLTPRNLDWHLNHYDDVDPHTGQPFRVNTPFISVTAGSVERDVFFQRNLVFDPFLTALQFATQDFTTTGHIFYAYVFTLGKPSIELEEFSEEVRELNIYRNFLPYHHEGEITAKILIRAPQLERWEAYDGPAALTDLSLGRVPAPSSSSANTRYQPPERYCNIRGLVTD
jgi:hypothetical protein